MQPHKVLTPPSIYPLSVDATLRQHLRIGATDTSENDLILEYIKAATEFIERYIGYPLMTQIIEVYIGDMPKLIQDLTGNVNSLVNYSYSGGDEVNIPSTVRVDKYGLLSQMNNSESWISGTDYRIKCNAGYTTDTLPQDIKQACRLLVSHMYEVREPTKITAPDTVIERLDRHLLY